MLSANHLFETALNIGLWNFLVTNIYTQNVASDHGLQFVREKLVGWLFGLNGPLRQCFSLYRAVFQREREKEKRNDRRE